MEKKIVVVSFEEIPLRGHVKFRELAKYWYETKKEKITEGAWVNYQFTLNKLIDTFGDWYVDEIKPCHIDAFLEAAIDAELSKSYVRKLRSMMNQIMRKAEANKLADKNPVLLADRVCFKDSKVKVEEVDGHTALSFTEEEIKRLFSFLPHDKIGNAIRLMLVTGIRTQELLALEPKHLDIENSALFVRQAVKLVGGKANVGSPKSLSSMRDVPLPSSAICYAAMLVQQASGKYLIPGTMPDKPYNPSSFRHAYYTRLKACGVRMLSPHCCRHTYVSLMQNAGVDIETIKFLVGHSQVKMTEHYLHVQKQVKMDAVNRFDKFYLAAS